MRCLSFFLVACTVFAGPLLSGCGCPDLAWSGLRIEGVDQNGSTTNFNYGIRVTIQQIAADGTVAKTIVENGDPSNSMGAIPAGRFRISASVAGVSAGSLDDVCSFGDKTGCDADAMTDNDQSRVVIRQTSESGYRLELEHNGRCP